MPKFKTKKHRGSIEFDYEFEDGTVVPFTYLSTTTNQMEKSFDIKADDVKGQFDFSINILRENIIGDRVDDLIEDIKQGNIFDFKATLDEELGKQKKQR